MTFVPPKCPDCKKDMKVSGKLRTETKVKRLFQCMNLECGNHTFYTRKGVPR